MNPFDEKVKEDLVVIPVPLDHCYQLRFTCEGGLQCRIIDFIRDNTYGELIIARENGSENGREHIQCYAQFPITKKSWMNKFNEKFKKELATRDKYVAPDKGRTKSYVCKGKEPQEPYLEEKFGDGVKIYHNPEILNFRSLTSTIENNYNDYWCQIKKDKEIKQLLIKNPELIELSQAPIKEKKKNPPFMKIVREELIDDLGEDYEWSKNDIGIVFKKVMTKLGELCKSLDHIIITRMVYGVLNSLIKDTKKWHQYWFQKCFPECENIYSVEKNMNLDE